MGGSGRGRPGVGQLTPPPSQPGPAGIRAAVAAHLAELEPTLLALSHQIHAHPELRFEEFRASQAVAEQLSACGFEVALGAGSMPTALVATTRLGSGVGPVVDLLCEYDALESIGHACGHNLIAAAGVGGGVVAARTLAGTPGVSGTIRVVGCPGEEGGGGKIRLLEAGVFSTTSAALMVHPAGFDSVRGPGLGRALYEFAFSGRGAHAAAAPEEGINALDAATLMLVAIGLLRQQLRSDSRVHAVIAEGGQAVNVIPARATVRAGIRSPDSRYLAERLIPAVTRCARGAALATGAEVAEIELAPEYHPMRSAPALEELLLGLFTELGRHPDAADDAAAFLGGSTDMGNVSEAVPSIHPYLRLAPGVHPHSLEFAQLAGSTAGDRMAMDGALLLGMTAVALLTQPDWLARASLQLRGPGGVGGAGGSLGGSSPALGV